MSSEGSFNSTGDSYQLESLSLSVVLVHSGPGASTSMLQRAALSSIPTRSLLRHGMGGASTDLRGIGVVGERVSVIWIIGVTTVFPMHHIDVIRSLCVRNRRVYAPLV